MNCFVWQNAKRQKKYWYVLPILARHGVRKFAEKNVENYHLPDENFSILEERVHFVYLLIRKVTGWVIKLRFFSKHDVRTRDPEINQKKEKIWVEPDLCIRRFGWSPTFLFIPMRFLGRTWIFYCPSQYFLFWEEPDIWKLNYFDIHGALSLNYFLTILGWTRKRNYILHDFGMDPKILKNGDRFCGDKLCRSHESNWKGTIPKMYIVWSCGIRRFCNVSKDYRLRIGGTQLEYCIARKSFRWNQTFHWRREKRLPW